MKNSAIVLVWSTNRFGYANLAALKEVLYTPSINWVGLTLEELGYEKVVIQGGQNLEEGLVPKEFPLVSARQLGNWLEAETREHILLLGADAPLIKKEDIQNSKNDYDANGMKITLFEDKDRYITGAGWYDRKSLLELVNIFKEEFTLNELYEKMKEKEIESASYKVENCSILPVNTAVNLNKINEIAKNRIIDKHLGNNVEIILRDGVIISPLASIEKGSVILPGSIIKGKSSIGSCSEIGPNSVIDNAIIGNNNKIISSYVEFSRIGNSNNIGPMSRLRPNTVIGDKAKIGNFVEVKNSNIGDKTSISHLTYVGDSDVGQSCNIGCGVVTVNYNGRDKNRTVLGDNVFVGCNCNLVAPVKLADGAYAAAGTTITENVPKDSLVIGRAKQTVKENWAKEKGYFNKK